MGYNTFGVNDAMAVKLWSKDLARAEREATAIAPLIGTGANNIIQRKMGLSKGKGDQMTVGLRARLQGQGISSTMTAEGNGEQLAIYSFPFVINELGHVVGVPSENTIDAQRVPFELREEARDGLSEWFSDRKSVTFFNHVCGNTAATDLRYTGNNAVTAPSSNRRVFGGAAGVVTADEGLTSSHPFTLDLIDRAKTMAKIGDPVQRVRPLKIGGLDKYVVYLHTKQVQQMRTDTTTGQWLDITKFAFSGVDTKNNPIYSGALGEYNGCILRESADVTTGCNSSSPTAAITTVRRAVLLGAQAAVIGYGQKGSPSRYRWNEELLDHKRKLEVSAWSIFGMKKAVWNGQDFGTVTISTYAD